MTIAIPAEVYAADTEDGACLLQGYEMLFLPDHLNLPYHLLQCSPSDAFRLLEHTPPSAQTSASSNEGHAVADSWHAGVALSDVEVNMGDHSLGNGHNVVGSIDKPTSDIRALDQDLAEPSLLGTLCVPITNIDEYYEA